MNFRGIGMLREERVRSEELQYSLNNIFLSLNLTQFDNSFNSNANQCFFIRVEFKITLCEDYYQHFKNLS
jgi:hypothetical protein